MCGDTEKSHSSVAERKQPGYANDSMTSDPPPGLQGVSGAGSGDQGSGDSVEREGGGILSLLPHAWLPGQVAPSPVQIVLVLDMF